MHVITSECEKDLFAFLVGKPDGVDSQKVPHLHSLFVRKRLRDDAIVQGALDDVHFINYFLHEQGPCEGECQMGLSQLPGEQPAFLEPFVVKSKNSFNVMNLQLLAPLSFDNTQSRGVRVVITLSGANCFEKNKSG